MPNGDRAKAGTPSLYGTHHLLLWGPLATAEATTLSTLLWGYKSLTMVISSGQIGKLDWAPCPDPTNL